jgi:hypothetical protein
METLFPDDLVSVLRRTPKAVFDLLKDHPRLFMAGGFLRACIAREEVSDVDLFAHDKEYARGLAESLSKKLGKDMVETDNAFTVYCRPAPIQFIHRWTFSDPIQCLKSFDFTIAQAAVWFDSEWKSSCSERFYADLSAKRLVYLSPIRNEDAGGSMIRVLKFYQRGYRIPLDSLGAVIARICGGVKKDTEEKRNAWDTDEAWRAKIITGLLREVDPNSNPDRYLIPAPSVPTEGA